MKQEELKNLSREELEIIFCDFYNTLDNKFDELRIDKKYTISELYNTFINSSRKVLQKIKICEK